MLFYSPSWQFPGHEADALLFSQDQYIVRWVFPSIYLPFFHRSQFSAERQTQTSSCQMKLDSAIASFYFSEVYPILYPSLNQFEFWKSLSGNKSSKSYRFSKS